MFVRRASERETEFGWCKSRDKWRSLSLSRYLSLGARCVVTWKGGCEFSLSFSCRTEQKSVTNSERDRKRTQLRPFARSLSACSSLHEYQRRRRRWPLTAASAASMVIEKGRQYSLRPFSLSLISFCCSISRTACATQLAGRRHRRECRKERALIYSPYQT